MDPRSRFFLAVCPWTKRLFFENTCQL